MARKHIFLFLSLLFASLAGFSQEKYAIGMFHFNLQLCSRRLQNRKSYYSRIALSGTSVFLKRTRSTKPISRYRVYGIEVLAEEHPKVFKLFKKLVNRGQIELVIASLLRPVVLLAIQLSICKNQLKYQTKF